MIHRRHCSIRNRMPPNWCNFVTSNFNASARNSTKFIKKGKLGRTTPPNFPGIAVNQVLHSSRHSAGRIDNHVCTPICGASVFCIHIRNRHGMTTGDGFDVVCNATLLEIICHGTSACLGEIPVTTIFSAQHRCTVGMTGNNNHGMRMSMSIERHRFVQA